MALVLVNHFPISYEVFPPAGPLSREAPVVFGRLKEAVVTD